MKVQYRIYDHPSWGTGMLMRQSRDGSALIRTADGETVWRRAGHWRELSDTFIGPAIDRIEAALSED